MEAEGKTLFFIWSGSTDKALLRTKSCAGLTIHGPGRRSGAVREDEWDLKPVDLPVMSCVTLAEFFFESELA